uniref:Uncharacterized protein n=1 Tax=Desertifilum tharense IPPAS B-1220 TaxID=1781255 RepID=A0ACD5GQY5_9CYAN
MNNGIGSPLETWQDQLQQATDSIHQLAQQSRGDAWALLHLLRSLEAVHQEIRDSVFQEALPNNRQELYNFLREIEANGGWHLCGADETQTALSQLGSSAERGKRISGCFLSRGATQHFTGVCFLLEPKPSRY